MDEEHEEYTEHPLFAEREEPFKRALSRIDIRKFASHNPPAGAKSGWIDKVWADECLDEGAIREQFGDGFYELVGRDVGRTCIVARCRVHIYPAAAQHHGQAPPPGPARASSPESAMFEKLGELLGGIEARLKALEGGGNATFSPREMWQMMTDNADKALARQEAHSSDLIKTVTTMAQGRISDQRSLIDALTAVHKNDSGGGEVERGFELYERTLASAMAVKDALSEGAADGPSEMQSVVEGIKAMADLNRQPAGPVVQAAAAAQAAGANGSGNGVN